MAVEYDVPTVVATIPAYLPEPHPPVKETAPTLSTAVPSAGDVPTVNESQGDYEKGSAYGRFLSISSFNNKSKYRKAARKIPICGYFSVSAMSILYCKKQGDGRINLHFCAKKFRVTRTRNKNHRFSTYEASREFFDAGHLPRTLFFEKSKDFIIEKFNIAVCAAKIQAVGLRLLSGTPSSPFHIHIRGDIGFPFAYKR